MRRGLLVSGQVYHVFTRSIAEFKIFNHEKEFSRMLEVIRYYQREKPEIKFSKFVQLEYEAQHTRSKCIAEKEKLVEIIAYCVMPTHIHLILRQLKENGISTFMSNILNSYTKYFNTKHERKGPLWEARFKSIAVETDEYLLHLTRYIHLNPVTAALIDEPKDWGFSSYREYLSTEQNKEKVCKYDDVLDINPDSYRQFVEDRISYQRELAKIKALLLE
ncbi:MAG: transposase [Candidatus Omnitrophota bacterium]|nr:transposase [Candidatus Omnitrophota bacterium]